MASVICIHDCSRFHLTQGPSKRVMMELFEKQAERFGADIAKVDATSVDLDERPFRVETEEGSFTADAR